MQRVLTLNRKLYKKLKKDIIKNSIQLQQSFQRGRDNKNRKEIAVHDNRKSFSIHIHQSVH